MPFFFFFLSLHFSCFRYFFFFMLPPQVVKTHADTSLSDSSFSQRTQICHTFPQSGGIFDTDCGETCKCVEERGSRGRQRSDPHPQYLGLSSAAGHLASITGNLNARRLWVYDRGHMTAVGSNACSPPQLYFIYLFVLKFLTHETNCVLFSSFFMVLRLQPVGSASQAELLTLSSVKYSTTYFIWRP